MGTRNRRINEQNLWYTQQSTTTEVMDETLRASLRVRSRASVRVRVRVRTRASVRVSLRASVRVRVRSRVSVSVSVRVRSRAINSVSARVRCTQHHCAVQRCPEL